MSKLSEYAAKTAEIQRLPLEPDFAPSVEAHLEVAFRLAALVLEFDLPDEAEPAPVFCP